MQDFVEELSAGARVKLDEGGITELAEIISFSTTDLQSVFNFTVKDLVLLKRHTVIAASRKRLRGDEDESEVEGQKNESRLVLQMHVCARAALLS